MGFWNDSQVYDDLNDLVATVEKRKYYGHGKY